MLKTIRRLANVSQEKALEEFQAAYPDSQTIYPFPTEERDGVAVYVARVVNSEFPFAKGDDDSGSDDSGSEEKSEPKSDSGDDSSSDSKPKDHKSEGGGTNKEVLDLVKQIAQAVGVPVDSGLDGDMVPPPDNLELPDVGAPPQGAPLPPPASPHPGMGGLGGGNSFSSTLGEKFMAFVEDADGMTPRQAAEEANANFPGYVAHHAGIRQARYNGRDQIIAIAEMHKS